MELTRNGKFLITTLLFRLFFGGYLAGMDQYSFNDVESALTVLLIYGLVGAFTVLFLLGKRFGLHRNNRLRRCFRYFASYVHNCLFDSNRERRFARSSNKLVGNIINDYILRISTPIFNKSL